MKSKIYLLATLSLLFLLSACSSYESSIPEVNLIPEAEVLEIYMVDSRWWLAYEIDELNALVETALANNIDYAKSAIRVNRALYQAKIAADELWPALTGSVSANVNDLLGTSNPLSESYGTSLGLNYEIDLWQKIRDGANADKLEIEATLQDQEAIKLTLINSVIDTYFNLLYLQEALDNTQYSIDYYEETLSYINTRYEYGRVSALEVYTAQQALLNAENSYLDLRVQQKDMGQIMRDLLNLAPNESIATSFGNSSLNSNSLENGTLKNNSLNMSLNTKNVSLLNVVTGKVNLDIPITSLSLRPDVKAAQYRLEKSFYNLEAMEKSWLPSISIGSALNTSGTNILDLFGLPMLSANLRISLPFLQWNTVKWNVRTSEADFEEAKLDFIQTVNTALNEVDTFYFTYEQMLESFANQEKLYAVEQEIVKNRQTRYQVGADDLKYLLDAKKSENDARLNLLKAKYTIIKYENAIYKAMGGKLQEITPS